MKSGLVLFVAATMASALSGCGPNNPTADGGDVTPNDVSTDTPTDVRVDARRDVQAPADPCATDAVIDISGRTPDAGGTIHVLGDSFATLDEVGPQPPAGCITYQPDTHHAAHLVVFKYTMRTAAGLRVSTDNTDTIATFDTIVYVLDHCSTTGASLACNDDEPAGNSTHSTALTAGSLAAGTEVYIVVAGYSPPAGMDAVDNGAFGLDVREVPTTAVGGTCTAGQSICATGAHCIPTLADPMADTCQTDGLAGTLCRDAAPRCDTTLVCSAATATAQGVCRAVNPAGGTCDPTGRSAICTTPAVCAHTTASAGLCVTTVVNETEPNDTPATAGAAVHANTVFSAAITPATDADCFNVTVTAGQSLLVETNDGMGGCPAMADTFLSVYAAGAADGGTGVALGTDDDAGPGSCSLLDGTTAGPTHGLAAGTYSVCVSSTAAPGGTAMAIAQYNLDISILP